MKNIMFILFVSSLLIACSKNNEQHQQPPKTDKKVQEDWSKRNQSNIDLDNHKSKGF